MQCRMAALWVGKSDPQCCSMSWTAIQSLSVATALSTTAATPTMIAHQIMMILLSRSRLGVLNSFTSGFYHSYY